MNVERICSLRGRHPSILGHEEYFRSAVLLPLVMKDNQICIIFEKRADNIHQPGEVSFPGGRIDADDAGPEQAAVRETCEELGLHLSDIEVIAPLDIMVSPFNVIVYPYLAQINSRRALCPNPDEVAEVFYVPLDFFLNYEPMRKSIYLTVGGASEDFPFEIIPQGKNYPFRKGVLPQFFYLWEDYVIWGLTARIINHFVGLIRN